ncbi:hypothetical protein [Aquidulcibacter sp.]|uniref:hypothetical protein n=1 Tax=Aquidulcibacter sp. TaxID=2052990 RepID=UPI0028AD94D1|nr:hypothetical protein [Aquidulcibacter sp.]
MLQRGDERQFANDLWQLLVDLISGIDNAPGDRFSDQSPNWLTRSRLVELRSEFTRGLKLLGVIEYTAHAPCGHPNHKQLAKWKHGKFYGYWRVDLGDGRTDAEFARDGELVIDGEVMQTDFECMTIKADGQKSCPCSKVEAREAHTVGNYFAWPQRSQSKLQDICRLVEYFDAGIEKSSSDRPRSAIREQLLWSLIHLERIAAEKSALEIFKRN